MQTLNEVLEAARRLSAEEQERLVEALTKRLLLEELDAMEEDRRESSSGDRRKAAMEHWLAMAGTGHSDQTDVSENKNKYLAEAYATKP
jgi:hypothetical protein